eukprot:8771259-Alexandrium_andersonii.AAC.1
MRSQPSSEALSETEGDVLRRATTRRTSMLDVIRGWRLVDRGAHFESAKHTLIGDARGDLSYE